MTDSGWVDVPTGQGQDDAGWVDVSAQEEPKKKGVVETAVSVPRGIADSAAALLSGAVAWPVSKVAGGIAGVADQWQGKSQAEAAETAKAIEENTANTIQVQPDTDLGKQAMQTVGKVLDPIFGTAREMSDLPAESMGLRPFNRWLLNTAAEFTAPAKIHKVAKGINEYVKAPGRPRAIPPMEETAWKDVPTAGADALKEAATAGEAEILAPAAVETPVAVKRVRGKKAAQAEEGWVDAGNVDLSSKIEPSEQTTPVAEVQPAVLQTGGRVRYRGKDYTVEEIGEGGVKVFGREKPLNPTYTKPLPGEPVDLATLAKDYDTLKAAGYPESELVHMDHATIQQHLTERADAASAPPTLEQLNQQKVIRDNILRYQKEKALADIQLLKENGVDEGRIASMSDFSIRQKAAELRAGGAVTRPEHIKGVLDEFDKMQNEINKPIDQMTPEEIDRLTATLGEAQYESPLVDSILTDHDDYIKLVEEGITDEYLAKLDTAAGNRALDEAARLGDKDALAKQFDKATAAKGRVLSEDEVRAVLQKFAKGVKKTEGQTVVKRVASGESKVTKLPEFTKDMADLEIDTEPIAPTRGPRARNKPVVEERDWEAKLAEEGMPNEINFDEFLSKAQIISFRDFFSDPDNLLNFIDHEMETKAGRLAADATLKELEARYANGTKGEKETVAQYRSLSKRREAFDQAALDAQGNRPWDVVDGRGRVTQAYGYMPSSFNKTFTKERFFAAIADIEKKANQNDIAHRTGPNVRVELNRLKELGEITPEQHAWMDAVVAGFDGRANFDLIFGKKLLEADLKLKAEGKTPRENSYYSFAKNVMQVRNLNDFIHEVGHPAFDSYLTPRERMTFAKSLVEQFYDKDGKYDRVKIGEHLNTTNLHEIISPAEIFCRELQNYIGKRAHMPQHSALYQKAITFMKNILVKAFGSEAIPLERRVIYDRIFTDLIHPDIIKSPKTATVRGPRRIPASQRATSMSADLIPKMGDEVSVRRESIPTNTVTLDSLGFQQIYDKLSDTYMKLKSKEQNPINKVTEELGGTSEQADRINRGMPPRKDAEGNPIASKEKPVVPDILGVSQWIFQPLGEPVIPGQPKTFLRKIRGGYGGWADGTPAEPIVYRANLAEQASSFHHANNVIGLREAQIYLHKLHSSGEELTQYIRDKKTDEYVTRNLNGKDTSVHVPGLNEAAGKVRDWLDYMRDRYRDFLKGEYARFLNKKESGALYDLINGRSVAEVGKKWKIENLDVVKDIFDKYNELENWGIDDYLPKVELGSYRILDDTGTVRAVALSQKHAVEKIMGLMDTRADYLGDYYIDNTPRSALTEQLTGISSRKAYYAIVNKLAKAITSEVEGIDKGIARKMAERSVKKQFSIKPVDKYSEFVEERRDYLQGEKDIFPVLAKYSRVMEKKMALDPVIHEFKKSVKDTLPPNLKAATERLIEDVKGRYWQLDKWVDELFNIPYKALEKRGVDVGPPPVMTVSRVLGRAREWEANIKLGYRPANAAVNYLSGQGHVWTKVGARYIVDAYKYKDTPEGRAFLKEMGPYMGMTFADEGLGTYSTRRAGESRVTTYGKPLGLFQAVEIPNREIGIVANYLMAKDKFKMSEAAAKETAIRANWFQNFTYNLANMPALLRGPLGKTLGQFKPYMFKELEFIASLRPVELVRYTFMQMALGGPRAGMYVLKSLPLLAAVAQVDEVERWLNTNYPRLSRGIPGFMGSDISAMAAFQLPTDVKDLAGPFMSDIINFFKIIAEPVISGTGTVRESATLEKGNELMMENVPFWRGWNDIWNNVLTGDRQVRDAKTGRVARDQPLWEDTDTHIKKILEAAGYSAKRFVGAQDLQVSTERLEESLDKKEEARLSEALASIQDRIAKRLASGQDVPQWMWDRKLELMEKGKDVSGKGLTTVVENQLLPPTVRRLRRSSQQQQQDIVEHAPQYD